MCGADRGAQSDGERGCLGFVRQGEAPSAAMESTVGGLGWPWVGGEGVEVCVWRVDGVVMWGVPRMSEG